MPGTGTYTRLAANPLVEEYLSRFQKALGDVPDKERSEALLELRAHIEDALAALPTDDPRAVAAILADLGSPEEYANNLKQMTSANGESGRVETKASGTFMGMPYDFGKPTAQKLAERLWNPSDPRIMMPKVFGAGWTINLGAVAVKLGLIRPDDEEEQPFSCVPDGAIRTAMIVPILLNALCVFATVKYFPLLPAELPIHFDILGNPNRFTSPLGAIAWLLAPSLVLLMGLTPVIFSKRRSQMAKSLSVSVLVFMSTMCSAIYLGSLYYGLNSEMPFNPGAGVLASIAFLFLTLVSLSKIGLREEWRRSLKTEKPTGR